MAQSLLPEQHGGSKSRILNVKNISHSYRYDFLKFNPELKEMSLTQRVCSSVETEEKRNAFFAGENKESFEHWMKRTIEEDKDLIKKNGVNYIIPVVVHILYSTAPENIPDEQILSQINVLNDDFNRKNKDTLYTSARFAPLATEIGITFRLATLDPFGKPTNGIDRISMSGSPFSENYINNVIKPNTVWDVNNYLNIWVCSIEKGVLGFSQFPRSSGLEGIPLDVGAVNTDGVVINTNAFGTIGNIKTPFHKGRTTTHEVGHWLGLRHIWGDGDCTATDYCEDTPPVGGPNFGCNHGKLGCKSPAMVENFMDYTNDSCMNMFSLDQKARVISVLNNSPERKSLIRSNKANPPISPPIPLIAANLRYGLEGTEIQFYDETSGDILKRKWEFSGGTPAMSSDKNPKVLYTKAGIYPVKLTETNAFGSGTTIEERYIIIRKEGVRLPFSVDFEREDLIFNGENPLINMGTGGARWAMASALGGYGRSGGALYSGNYHNNKLASKSWFFLPPLDFSSGEQTQLSFDLAYRGFGIEYSDTLGVFLSADKGKTYHAIYFKYGNTLNRDTTHNLFYPQPEDWKTEKIDLSEYDGKPDVRIVFINYNGYGNNLYLDNLKVSSPPLPLPEAAFRADRREVCVGEPIQIIDESTHKPFQWKWSFPGAIIPADTIQNPVISYSKSGVYDIILTVYNQSGGISSFKKGYITVKPAPEILVEGLRDTLCPGTLLTLHAKGAKNFVWSYNDKKAIGEMLNDSLEYTTTLTLSGIGVNGCNGKINHTVFVKTAAEIGVAPTTVSVCKGEEIQIKAFGGESYQWIHENLESDKFASSIREVPLKNTNYKVRIKAASGCVFTKQIPVLIGEIPEVVIASPKTQVCKGQSIVLTGKGASAYYWSNGKSSKMVEISPETQTTIGLKGISEFGCSDSTTITISVLDLPILTILPASPSVCKGETLTLQASGGEKYSWASGDKMEYSSQPSFSITPSYTQVYTLSGQSKQGCQKVIEVPVTVFPKPEISISADNYAVCKGETVVLKARGSSQYTWKSETGKSWNGEIVSIFPEKTQTYQLFTKDSRGCTAQDSIRINALGKETPTVSFSLKPEQALCTGSPLYFLQECTGAKQYFWEFPGGEPAVSSLQNPIVQYSKPGAYDVTLRVEGCESSEIKTVPKMVVITETPAVEIILDKKVICSGDSVWASVKSAAPIQNYQWETHSYSISREKNQILFFPSDTETLRFQAGFASGCKAIATANVPVIKRQEDLILSTTQIFVCKGDSITIKALNGKNHQWKYEHDKVGRKGSGLQFVPLKSGKLTVSALSSEGCNVQATTNIMVYPKPEVTVSPNMILLCKNGSVTLEASGASNYRWSPEVGLNHFAGKTVSAMPASTQTYGVTGTDENGCSTTAFATIGVSDMPAVALSAEYENICKGDIARIQATGEGMLRWNPNTGIVEKGKNYILASPEVTTTYTVESVGEDGCESKSAVSIQVHQPQPIEILPAQSVICFGDSILLQAQTSHPVRWAEPISIVSAASKKIIVSPTETTVYTLHGWDEKGCEMIGLKTVTVKKRINARISAPTTTVCEGGELMLEAHGGKDYNWLPAQGLSQKTGAQVLVAPKKQQTYRVVVRDEDGCRDTANFDISARLFNPVVSISKTTLDLAKEKGIILFEDKTPDATQWLWDFGDGGKSDQKKPKHVFTTPGEYQISLTVSNGICEKTYFQTIRIDDSSDITVIERNKSLSVSIDTQNKLTFSLSLPSEMLIRVTVENANKEALLSGNLLLKKGENYHTIDLSSYPENRFYLILEDSKGRKLEKMLE